jgi:hypothetical protein
MLVLLGIAVASSAGLVWVLAGDDDAPTLIAASSVSTGPKLVSVPDVVGIVPGWTEQQARTQLERRGLRVRVVEDPTADAHAVGATLRQDVRTPVHTRECRQGRW